MERQEAIDKMKTLKGKAIAARKEGKKAMASAFRSGAARLQRKIRTMPAPKATEEAEAE